MAGSSLIGNLSVLLSMDTAAFEKGATHAQKLMSKTQRQFSQLGDRISGIGKKMSIGITAPFVGLMSQAIPAATKARAAMAQVEAGLASMGGASGKTAEELQKSAKALQSVSTFNKNDILDKVTANMLTFGNVTGKNFDRAQQAVVDMATRLKMDLQPATIMIGKALNDPVKGLTAMGRAGIQFTEDQKEMIKAMVAAGDAAGAQTIILKELERQFGGSAKAARDAAPGSDTIDAWRQFQETVGEVALKVLPPLTNILTKVLELFNNLSPATQTLVVGVAAFAAAIGPVLMVLGPMVKMVGAMLPLIVKLAPAFAALRVAMLAVFANPFVLGAAVLIGGIYLAWRNWDKITAIVQRVYEGVKNWFGDKLKAIFDGVKRSVEAVTGTFKTMYDRVVGNSYVPDMVDGIEREFNRLDDVMVYPAEKAAAAVGSAFDELEKKNPFQLWAETIPQTVDQITEAFQSITAYGLDSLADGIADVIAGTKSLGQMFGDVAKQMLNDIIRLIARMIIFRTLASAFPGMFGGGMGVPANVPGMARGGSGIFGGFGGIDKNVLSLNGSPIAKVSKGEHFRVSPTNDNAGEMVVHVNASPELDVRIERVSGNVVAAAAPSIVRASTQHTAKSLGRPRLG